MPRTFAPASRAACLAERSRKFAIGISPLATAFAAAIRYSAFDRENFSLRSASTSSAATTSAEGCARSPLRCCQSQRRDQFAAQRDCRLQADLLAHDRPGERLPWLRRQRNAQAALPLRIKRPAADRPQTAVRNRKRPHRARASAPRLRCARKALPSSTRTSADSCSERNLDHRRLAVDQQRLPQATGRRPAR